MLPDPVHLIAFAVAAAAVIFSPGPDTAYVLTRAVGEGRLAGVTASLGVSSGMVVHVVAATFGLSRLFDYAPVAYDVLRAAGVAYLLYLAWRTLSDRSPVGIALGASDGRRRLARAWGEAALTNVLNPKVAVFFIAFLPQLADPARGAVALQIFTLGAIFLVAGFSWLAGLALTFGYFGDRLRKSESFWRWQRRAMGASLAAIALWLALPARR